MSELPCPGWRWNSGRHNKEREREERVESREYNTCQWASTSAFSFTLSVLAQWQRAIIYYYSQVITRHELNFDRETSHRPSCALLPHFASSFSPFRLFGPPFGTSLYATRACHSKLRPGHTHTVGLCVTEFAPLFGESCMSLVASIHTCALVWCRVMRMLKAHRADIERERDRASAWASVSQVPFSHFLAKSKDSCRALRCARDSTPKFYIRPLPKFTANSEDKGCQRDVHLFLDKIESRRVRAKCVTCSS